MRHLAFALILGLSTAAHAGRDQVVVVQSDDLEAYSAPVPAFLEALGQPAQVVNLHGRRVEADALVKRLRTENPSAVFCLGAKAAYAIHQGLPSTPMVYTSVLDPQRYGIEGRQVTGVGMHLEPALHLSQFTSFFPNIKRLGLLRGPALTDTRMRTLTAGAQAVGIELVVREVDAPRHVRGTLAGMADEIDGLWLLPDRAVLTRESFRAVTEETRRRGLPLLVETDDMVKAGALFAVVPDPDSLGRQAAGLVRRILGGAAPAILEVQQPEDALVVLNLRTLERAGIAFDKMLLDFVDLPVE